MNRANVQPGVGAVDTFVGVVHEVEALASTETLDEAFSHLERTFTSERHARGGVAADVEELRDLQGRFFTAYGPAQAKLDELVISASPRERELVFDPS